MRIFLCLWVTVCSLASAQLSPVPPPSTALPSQPFFITKAWIIGGVGDWDYMTMDPSANQLFIAHGPAVQVIDVESGTVAGVVRGLRQAHTVVLDQEGGFGYITDGPADMVRVFDRRSFQVVASIPTGPTPRSMAFDPASGLLFVVGAQATSRENQTPGGAQSAASRQTQQSRAGAPRNAPQGGPESTVTVIDTDRRIALAQIVLPGSLGFAQADGNGRIFITVSDRSQILRLDAEAIGYELQKVIGAEPATRRAAPQPAARSTPISTEVGAAGTLVKPLLLDWTPGANPAPLADAYPVPLRLDANCERPRALAIDTAHSRLFAACTNMRMVALNAATGQTVAALPIGFGADAIGYDPNRGLIFTANGGSDGSVTVIRQDVTDTYSVIQTLPTRQNARTLAINPSNGEVYLASVIYGAVLNNPPINGAPLKINAVDSSFQVLVIGN